MTSNAIHLADKDLYFNSHAHVERDSDLLEKLYYYFNFNSHAHVERDSLDKPLDTGDSNFNSHAHVERDQPRSCTIAATFKISTHTLTWSVTLDVVYIWCLLNVMRTYFFI